MVTGKYKLYYLLPAFFGLSIVPVWPQSQTASTSFQNSESWEVPGAVLAPGNYTIAVKDSLPDRQILTVRDSANHVKATFLATSPVGKDQKPSEGAFSFWPSSPGKPRIVRAWFAPGAETARQFTWPKEKAVAIAKASGQPVAAIDPASDTSLHHGGKTDEDREIVQLWLLTPVEAAPGQPGIDAKKLPAAQSAPSLPLRASAERPKLPKTASPGAEEILLGTLGLLSGLLLRGALRAERLR
jgi:hypothetical protein